MGGVQCCLKGCENEVGSRKFDSVVGRYELKCAPDDVTHENLKDLRVCINITAVYQQEGINLLRGKVLLDHAAMPSWAS